MPAVNDPNYYQKRDLENRFTAQRASDQRAFNAQQADRTARGQAWQQQVAEVARRHNEAHERQVVENAGRPASAPDAGMGWKQWLAYVALAAGLGAAIGMAQAALEKKSAQPDQPDGERTP